MVPAESSDPDDRPGLGERPGGEEPFGASSGSASDQPAMARADAPAGSGGPFRRRRHEQSPNMLPARETRRSAPERVLVRVIATCGIVAIGVAIAAIMTSSKSQGWIIGLVVSIVSVVLSAILWSSRIL